MVVVDKKSKPVEEEKQWENPVDPEKPADCREDEQLQRQLKEAERRKENLTNEGTENKEQTN